MNRVKITLSYDGTLFHGWQIQPNDRTVQGEVQKALSQLFGTEMHVFGCSRTDAGVHALGQCATFEWNSNMPVEKLPEVMNRRFGAGGEGRSGAAICRLPKGCGVVFYSEILFRWP